MSLVVGFYGEYSTAEKAVHALEDRDIESSRISLIHQDSNPTEEKRVNPWAGTGKNTTGGYMVSVETRSTEEQHVIQDILSNAGAIRLETRSKLGSTDPARKTLKGE